jgi:hypothetical protein
METTFAEIADVTRLLQSRRRRWPLMRCRMQPD